MTNKEILAELKKSYEYLLDIRENGCADHCSGQLETTNINSLEIAINEITKVYDSFRATLDDNECLVEIKGNTYLIGHTVSVDYDVPNDDIYINCFDIGYYWYNDNNFLSN